MLAHGDRLHWWYQGTQYCSLAQWKSRHVRRQCPRWQLCERGAKIFLGDFCLFAIFKLHWRSSVSEPGVKETSCIRAAFTLSAAKRTLTGSMWSEHWLGQYDRKEKEMRRFIRRMKTKKIVQICSRSSCAAHWIFTSTTSRAFNISMMEGFVKWQRFSHKHGEVGRHLALSTIGDFYTRQRRATNRTNMNLRQGRRDKARIAVSFRDPIWHDTYGVMYVANLATKNNFFGREKLFSCCWARNTVRTLVWLHIHMQCTHVRSYSSMTSFSALMPRLSFNGNHKLWTGFCARGKGQDVVFQVQVTCHLPSYHPSLHERLYVRANVVNCK